MNNSWHGSSCFNHQMAMFSAVSNTPLHRRWHWGHHSHCDTYTHKNTDTKNRLSHHERREMAENVWHRDERGSVSINPPGCTVLLHQTLFLQPAHTQKTHQTRSIAQSGQLALDQVFLRQSQWRWRGRSSCNPAVSGLWSGQLLGGPAGAGSPPRGT